LRPLNVDLAAAITLRRMRNTSAPMRDAALGATGLAALGMGVLIYLADRDGVQAWLLPRVGLLAHSHWFGAAGGWLPSALHAFAFALLSAALLPARGPARLHACAVWALVDIGFEAGQHRAIAPHLAAWLDAAGPSWLVGPLARYFGRGTFDPADLAAVLLGAAAAAALLGLARTAPETLHAA